MKRIVVAFALCVLIAPAAADELSATSQIRAGRAALMAEDPDKARADFEAALAHTDLSDDDRFAALVGLGRADIWLGDYRSASDAFGRALDLAHGEADRRVAAIGLAKALNANEYYAEALAHSLPYSPGSLEPTVETLRAQRALGLEDLAVPAIAAMPDAAVVGREGELFAGLRSDVDFALADRVGGNFTFSNDSDGLTVVDYGLVGWVPGSPGGDVFHTLRIASDVLTIEDRTAYDTLYDFSVGLQLRFGNAQHANVNLGEAWVGSWNFVRANADWDYRIDDSYDINASFDRSPILTTAAIANRLLFETYTLGGSARIADNVTIDPVVFHQDFSDGNSRDGASLRVVLSPYDLPVPATAVGAQLFARLFHSSQPSTGVYFNPADYNQAQLDVIAVHRFDDDWMLRARAGGGYQSVNGSVSASYDIELSLNGRLPGNGRAELRFNRNSFASNTGGGSGYWSNSASLIVAYPVGL
jgi:tetratricopeptide (TPR) repeat protein